MVGAHATAHPLLRVSRRHRMSVCWCSMHTQMKMNVVLEDSVYSLLTALCHVCWSDFLAVDFVRRF